MTLTLELTVTGEEVASVIDKAVSLASILSFDKLAAPTKRIEPSSTVINTSEPTVSAE